MKKNPKRYTKKRSKKIVRVRSKVKLVTRRVHKRKVRRNPRPILRAKSVRDLHVYGLKHHVCVEVDGKTIAQLKDTREMRTLAMRLAKTYKRKHTSAVVKVVAY